jgi:hypothetical protein
MYDSSNKEGTVQTVYHDNRLHPDKGGVIIVAEKKFVPTQEKWIALLGRANRQKVGIALESGNEQANHKKKVRH